MKLIDLLKIVVPAIIIAFVINNFVVVNVTIPSHSMEPTLMVKDRLFASRLSYVFSQPQRGDIIVFKKPDSETLFVKRVIGLPGDRVALTDGQVYINGRLEEKYNQVIAKEDFEEILVADKSYFLLGDNRNNSLDSRHWSFVFIKEEDIIGKIFIKYYPKIKIIGGNDGQ